MNKIYNFYAEVFKNMNIAVTIIMFSLSGLIGYIISERHEIIVGIIAGIFFLTLIVWNVHLDWNFQKKHKERLNEKYGNDPDWKTYNELKKKFNNQ